MTNEQIIYSMSKDLMEQGIIGVARVLELVDDNGNKFTVKEPETIHTYQAWKKLGFQVQKGEKAVARFCIWKHVTKKAKNEDEEDKERMFMKEAAFFSQSQVAPIEAAA